MNHMNHEKKNLFATFALQGGCLWKHRVVRYASCLTGMALAVVLGSVLALSAPSFAQAESETPDIAPTVEKAGDGGSVVSNTNIRIEATTDTTRTTVSTVEASGNITGTIEKSGVFVSHEADHDITITSEAKIKTVKHGIEAIHSGDGKLEIVNEGKIKKVEKDGIHATHSGDDLLKISSTKDIEAKNRAISALHSGAGDIEFSTDSSVEGEGEGVYAKHTGSGDLKISTEDRKNGSGGEIAASGRSISAHHEGSSGNIDIDISSGGSVTSRANDAIFIEYGDAASGSGDIALDVHGDVSGRYKGISASHNGTGDIGISAFSRVTGENDAGIFVEHGGSGNLVISLENLEDGSGGGAITSSGRGIFARHGGSIGNIDINVSSEGRVASTGASSEAIFAEHTGTGYLYINTGSGEIISSGRGIFARHDSSGDDGNGNIDINVSSGGSIVSNSGEAIFVEQNGDSRAYIGIGGRIEGHSSGISVNHNGSPDNGWVNRVNISVRPGSEISATNGDAIRASSVAASISIDVAGPVSGATGSSAIDIVGGYFSRLILRPGFSLDGPAVVTTHPQYSRPTRQSHDLHFSSGGSPSASAVLNLGELDFRGFEHWIVTGLSTWEVTGTTKEGAEFRHANIQRGSTLRLSDAVFNLAEDTSRFHIFGDRTNFGILEVVGRNYLRGSLNSTGMLEFVRGNTESSLTISGDYRGWNDWHELVFNVDLARQQANKLTIEGDSRKYSYNQYDPATVSMRTVGTGHPTEATASPVLIEVKGQVLADSFEGEETVGAYDYVLDHDIANGVNRWRFRRQGLSSPAAAGASAPTALSELAVGQLTSLRGGEGSSSPGFRDDAHGYTGGLWVEERGSRTSLEPNTITGSRLHIEDNRVRFGFDLPATNFMGGDAVMGAGVWKGLSTSDVSSSAGEGFINVESHAAALTASWRSTEGSYVDGHAQYIRFASDISADRLLLVRDNEGTGMSVSAEAGHRFAVPLGGMDFHVAPQIELVWSRVGFDNFVGPNSELVSLEDGDLVKGRLGLLWDGEWQRVGGSSRVYGGMNLRSALDGRTAVNVSGVSLASKQKDLSVDGHLGVSYEWDEGYAVHGEAVALRRDGAEDVRANLSVRINF